MKKILYTLLFTLLLVACDKNNDMDMIAPVAEVQNVIIEKSSIDLTSINATLDRLVANSKGRKSKVNFVGKSAVEGSYVKIASATTNGGIYYEFVFSDDIENCNPDGNNLENLYLVLNSDNFMDLRAGAPDGLKLLTIERNLVILFTLSFSEGLKVEGSEVTFVDGNGGIQFTF